ncbi:MAG: hypothetical protein IPJ30_06635 [Acidobacteria bacterium]|nr:hypothetical protein [Acidobacteriota bacterium]
MIPDSGIPDSRIPGFQDSGFQGFQIPDSRFQNSRIPDSRFQDSRIRRFQNRIRIRRFRRSQLWNLEFGIFESQS